MVNMMENPSPDSSMNSIGLQIAQAFGVENEKVYLLRYVTDDEFADKCEEMFTDKKKTLADIFAWYDYMKSIKPTRSPMCRCTHAPIEDVRGEMGSKKRSLGDTAIDTTTAAASTTGSTLLPTMTNGKIDSKQVNSTAKYCSDDVSENSTLRVPQLSDFVVEVDTGCS
ncbi:hypothetical protein FOZ62_031206, partial [Perkinsus olseni]